jgi:hypothetical protein
MVDGFANNCSSVVIYLHFNKKNAHSEELLEVYIQYFCQYWKLWLELRVCEAETWKYKLLNWCIIDQFFLFQMEESSGVIVFLCNIVSGHPEWLLYEMKDSH